jgi:hypothetical protein
MGLFRKSSKPSAPTGGISPGTGRYGGPTDSWITYAVEADQLRQSGEYWMAAQAGYRAYQLAPRDQKVNATGDMTIALNYIGDGAGADGDVIPFLERVVADLLSSGFLNSLPPYGGPDTPDAVAAWSVFPAASIALLKRAEAAGRSDILERRRAEVLRRLRANLADLAYMYDVWVRAQPDLTA